MSNDNKRPTEAPDTKPDLSTSTTIEAEEVRAPVDPNALSPEEEKVIRMLYGRSLKGPEALEFAPGASLETRLKLALIEASLLDAFEAGALEPDPQTGSPRSVFADKFEPPIAGPRKP